MRVLDNARATGFVPVLLTIVLVAFMSGCDKPTPPPQSTDYQLSLSNNSAALGTPIDGTVTGSPVSSLSARIMFDSIPAPISCSTDTLFTFLVPFLDAGTYDAYLVDTLGRRSNSISFTVLDPPATGTPPGEIANDMIQTTRQLVDAVLDASGQLRQLGALSANDSTVMSQDLERITTLVESMESEFVGIPDSVKQKVDAFLYSAGISDMLDPYGGKLSVTRRLIELKSTLQRSSEYDLFYILVAFDNLSLALSEFKAGLTFSSIAILIATGGVGAPASGVIAALSFSIGVVDNIIDGAIPSDLDSLRVEFVPSQGPNLNVGETAVVDISGYFSTQKDPVDATVDIIISGIFYGIEVNLADELSGVLENLALKLANAMSVSLDDVITNNEPVQLQGRVPVDIDYYNHDLSGMFESVGLSDLVPGISIALSVIDFFTPDFVVAPISFNTELVSYDPATESITALASGKLSNSNVTVDAWSNKPLCSGLLSFLCLGAEWPKVIEEAYHKVIVATILEPKNQVPLVEILSPIDGETYSSGDTILFAGQASDPEDGTLSGNSLTWTSDKDGQIGTGNSFAKADLSVNNHMIVLSAMDNNSNIGADTANIDVNIFEDSLVQLTFLNDPGCIEPRCAKARALSWSPDGSKIAFRERVSIFV